MYLFDTRVGLRHDLVFIPVDVGTDTRPDQCDLPVMVRLIFNDKKDSLMAYVANTSGEAELEADDLKPVMEMCIKVMPAPCRSTRCAVTTRWRA